jgi:hypothetical protein
MKKHCDVCGSKGVFVEEKTYIAQQIPIKNHVFTIEYIKDHDECFKKKFEYEIYRNFGHETVEIITYNSNVRCCGICGFYDFIENVSNYLVEFPMEKYKTIIENINNHDDCLKKIIKELQTELLGYW